MRVITYARYSTDLQSDMSIEDQRRMCNQRAQSEGWTVVEGLCDRAASGASMLRPGMQELLQRIRDEKCDVILAEALDRLSRDQEDIAHIYKRAWHYGIRIVTLSEGEINELHIGLKGTMSALFLKDLAQKTKRGLEGVALRGKSAGGNSYGYDVVRKLDANGEPVRGDRKVNEEQASVVRRILSDYVAGKSPKRIAAELNREGIPGPRGGAWGQSSINGNRKRGTGILNNELYIGRQIWNRQSFVSNPDTGKREARPNPPEKWVVTEVPELRIVDDELWERVKKQQEALENNKPQFWQKQRPRALLSGLLTCGCCGGGFSKVSPAGRALGIQKSKSSCRVLEKASNLILGRA